jgi:sugar phosphate isomerase/epimerase
MFQEIPSANFGLNFDPSHFVWQQMDYLKVLRDFADKMFHLHAKDARIDIDRLNDVGMLSYPNDYHTPKLPGLGDVKWGPFFATLGDIGYRGPICVEVEDRSFEGSLELRKASLVQSLAYLRQFATDPAQFA